MANPHNPNNPIAVRHRRQGKLVALHKKDFGKIQDICDLFGFQVRCTEYVRNGKTCFNYRGCEGAMFYRSTKGCTVIGKDDKIEAGSRIEVWWPSIKRLNRVLFDNKNGANWVNEIEQNDDVILEAPRDSSRGKKHVDGVCEYTNSDTVRRVVIAKYPKIGYSFLGVYQMDLAESQKQSRAVWKRIAKEFVL